MSREEQRESVEDKELYSYTEALSQPVWIQKLNEQYSLPTPIKLSRVIYFVIISFLIWQLYKPFNFVFGFKIVSAGFFGWYLAGLFSDLRVQGKSLFMYLKDYLIFYFRFGRKDKTLIINKGLVYKRVKAKKMRERKEV